MGRLPEAGATKSYSRGYRPSPGNGWGHPFTDAERDPSPATSQTGTSGNPRATETIGTLGYLLSAAEVGVEELQRWTGTTVPMRFVADLVKLDNHGRSGEGDAGARWPHRL